MHDNAEQAFADVSMQLMGMNTLHEELLTRLKQFRKDLQAGVKEGRISNKLLEWFEVSFPESVGELEISCRTCVREGTNYCTVCVGFDQWM